MGSSFSLCYGFLDALWNRVNLIECRGGCAICDGHNRNARALLSERTTCGTRSGEPNALILRPYAVVEVAREHQLYTKLFEEAEVFGAHLKGDIYARFLLLGSLHKNGVVGNKNDGKVALCGSLEALAHPLILRLFALGYGLNDARIVTYGGVVLTLVDETVVTVASNKRLDILGRGLAHVVVAGNEVEGYLLVEERAHLLETFECGLIVALLNIVAREDHKVWLESVYGLGDAFHILPLGSEVCRLGYESELWVGNLHEKVLLLFGCVAGGECSHEEQSCQMD